MKLATDLQGRLVLQASWQVESEGLVKKKLKEVQAQSRVVGLEKVGMIAKWEGLEMKWTRL